MHAIEPRSAANGVLASLPHALRERLQPGLVPVALDLGDVLYDAGEKIRHVYFPCDSIVSLVTLTQGHLALEVGLVGREGMVGVPLALGLRISPLRALVQSGGSAMRMDAARFLRELERSARLRACLHRCTRELMAQITRTAACNRFHTVDERLARLLLMTRDRRRSARFHLTHEFLAYTLGVRRVGVTQAASGMQRKKLIAYRRGDISILDPAGLEAASCACYEPLGVLPHA